MTDSAVSLHNVRKTYRDVRAVDGIDFEILRGETVALLGPNGAGKSTAIAIMLGLVGADSGTVSLFGRPPALGMTSGRVGAMLQSAGFVPNATVQELVELSRALYPHPMAAAEILATAGLTDIAGRRLEKLSGGEAQRARFAFALAGRPDLLILDEPTAAMDVASRRAFWAAMRRYSANGRTVLFATHYLEEADEFADRIIVIGRGRVIADGSADDIKQVAGGRTVSFALGDATTAGLDQLPGVYAMELRGNRVRLRTSDADETVLSLARTRGFRDLEVSGVSLEEAFLTLTADRASSTVEV